MEKDAKKAIQVFALVIISTACFAVKERFPIASPIVFVILQTAIIIRLFFSKKPENKKKDMENNCICPAECDCEYPEPEEGIALVSNSCPIHNLDPDPDPECPHTGIHNNGYEDSPG